MGHGHFQAYKKGLKVFVAVMRPALIALCVTRIIFLTVTFSVHLIKIYVRDENGVLKRYVSLIL